MKEHLDLGRWPEADELLDRALALPPEEREAFVRRATAHDRALGYALASIVREAGATQVLVAATPDENALFEALKRALPARLA